MAAVVLDDPVVQVQGISWSPWVNQITITRTQPVNAWKAFGQSGQQQAISSQSEDSLTINAVQHNGTAEFGALMEAVYGTLGTVVITQSAGSVSATNPSWTAVVAFAEYAPIDGAPGDLVEVPLTLPVNGKWVRSTS